uniref:3-deoxy-7-phosphoheptulonate synthase n=1 Tax=Spongospora subterranea TaxID=70186 RepID=A0A0H5R657_9EUKA|eukprot:CRZ09252.1 hypothetical protein [Spongospora subterranea]
MTRIGAGDVGSEQKGMRCDQEGECDVTDDLSIESYKPLISPALLREDLPITRAASQTVLRGRSQAEAIISGRDDRLLVIVGPCSLHDPVAAMEYGRLLRPAIDHFSSDLHIVMRAYFEKPRTTVGWKGLINDPDLNGTFRINKGLRVARRLLLDLNEMGVPVGVELLDTISPQFIADLVSWGAIGARTTECQLHRELASGVSFPVGFKNGTSGDTQIAVDAIVAATEPHVFLGVNNHGLATICRTTGNRFTHLILRGGASGPNYDPKSVQDTVRLLQKKNSRNQTIMIDCSHGNSLRLHKNQPLVANAIADQVAQPSGAAIIGAMIESNLVEGKQDIGGSLRYGQSITDACVSWQDTVPMLERLAHSVRQRRSLSHNR